MPSMLHRGHLSKHSLHAPRFGGCRSTRFLGSSNTLCNLFCRRSKFVRWQSKCTHIALSVVAMDVVGARSSGDSLDSGERETMHAYAEREVSLKPFGSSANYFCWSQTMTCWFMAHDRHVWHGRYAYGTEDWSAVACSDPCLREFARHIEVHCHPQTWSRMLLCPMQTKNRILGTMAGYERRRNGTDWCPDYLLRMMLANEALRHPNCWIETSVVGSLCTRMEEHVPRVGQWLSSFSERSLPLWLMCLRTMDGFPMRIEQWKLISPTERHERVLVCRT